MGLIDKKNHIIDFQLTNKGRELLSQNSLNFSYYAFSDDGIDYSGSLDYVNTPYRHFASTRIQSVTTGSFGAGVTQITGTLSSVPQSGSTMIAVMGMQSLSTVSSVTQTGASWSRLTASTDSVNNTECEIWWARNVGSGAGTSISVGVSSICQLVVNAAEYSGIISVDKSASNALGSTFATGSTGITPTTTEDFELWIGGMSSVVSTSQTASSPGSVQVGFTGSSILHNAMYEKYVTKKQPAELIVRFSPDGTVVGTICTFKVSTSASIKESFDENIHVNTFAFEPLRREDKAINNFLFTMPLENDVVTQFNSSLTGSFNMKRKYEVETLENVVNQASDINKIISQENVLDYVVIVEETPTPQEERSKKYILEQLRSPFDATQNTILSFGNKK